MNNAYFTRLIHRAYIRDQDTFHTGEALMLACLLHTHGAGRTSTDMTDLRRIMKDHNLDKDTLSGG